MPTNGVPFHNIEFYMFRKNVLSDIAKDHDEGSIWYKRCYKAFIPVAATNTPANGIRMTLMEHLYLIEDLIRNGVTFRISGYVVQDGTSTSILDPNPPVDNYGEVD